ncbi:BTB And C-terminal Kelch [Sparganum proliferum]
MALPQTELFEDQFPLIRSCPALNEIRLAQDIKDLRIEVKGGTVLHADRIILAARVPSLRTALSGPLGEDNSVLRWPTVPLNLATTFIQYVYTGQVEMTQSNARGMVTLAKMVKLPDLVNWGVAFMVRGLNLESLPAIWDLARTLNVEVLAEKCVDLMKEKFEQFVQTDLFVSLPAETVLTLLRSDDISVESEEQVIAAITRWVDAGGAADDEKLRVHAPAMLKEVQWQLTSVQCRSRLLDSYPKLRKSPECLCLMLQVEHWISAAEKDKPLRPFNIRPRVRQTYFFLFGVDKGQERYSVLRVDAHLQRAERVADMKGRRYASYSVVGESIFVVGGCNPRRADVDEFLVREGRWRERTPLAVARWAHAAAVMKVPATAAAAGEKTLIGVFGGWGGDGRLSSCELYDVSQDRWHKLPDLPEKRSGPAAACLPRDSRVFLFGGYDFSSALSSVVFCHLRADWQGHATSADFWKPAAPMRTARDAPAATPFRGAILVAGGHDGQRNLNAVEMFSLPDACKPLGQWTELAGMEQPRCLFTLLSAANAVFALGNEDEPKNTAETLTAPGGSTDVDNDLSSWVWSSMSTMETLEWIVGAASIRM